MLPKSTASRIVARRGPSCRGNCSHAVQLPWEANQSVAVGRLYTLVLWNAPMHSWSGVAAEAVNFVVPLTRETPHLCAFAHTLDTHSQVGAQLARFRTSLWWVRTSMTTITRCQCETKSLSLRHARSETLLRLMRRACVGGFRTGPLLCLSRQICPWLQCTDSLQSTSRSMTQEPTRYVIHCFLLAYVKRDLHTNPRNF